MLEQDINRYMVQTDILVAFYKNDRVNNKDIKRLFVNIPTKDYIYEQELLPQPDWLNSQEGIIKMLQACLGDFSRLLDPAFENEEILDPCIQCIINKTAVKAGLSVSANDKSCQAADAFIKGIKEQIAKNEQEKTVPPPVIEPPPPSDDGSAS